MSRRLVVAIVVKDNARTISKIFRGIAGLKNVFDDIAFAVYENNSTDGTKDVLKRLSSEIEGVRVLSEDLSYEQQRQVASVRHKDGRVCRIEILAYARQRVRELVLEEFGDSNYVLVVDVDAVLFSFKGIERASNMIDAGIADCVTANGLTKRLKYRDAFAFRSLEHPIGPEFLGDYWTNIVRKRIQKRLWGRDPIPVFSAFGGAALYSMDAYRAGRYTALPDEKYLAQHRKLDFSHANADELGKASKYPIANTNFLSPIVCEHVPFCYEMREKGYGRIVVDPRWRLLFID